jgi:hypothetical protein
MQHLRRANILLWIAHNKAPDRFVPMLKDFLASGEIIDDHTTIEIAKTVVAARIGASATTSQLIEIITCLDHTKPWEFYAKLWILSKYGSCNDIMSLIESTVSIWVTQELFSRLTAGVFPRFIGSSLQGKFENIIMRVGSRWAQDVLSFHFKISRTTDGFRSVRKFVEAPNKSQPNLLTHAKFLMLLSLLHNKSIAPSAIAQLRARHAFALTDEFYAKIAPPPTPFEV